MTESIDIIGTFFLRWRTRKAMQYVEGNLLDVACGRNHLVRMLGKGMGLDIAFFPYPDVMGCAMSIPFKDETFDTVTVIAALNHISQREKALSEIYRVLKKNGRIVITMPPPLPSKLWHIFRSYADFGQHMRSMKAGEVYGMSIGEILSLLEGAKFTSVMKKKFALGMHYLVVGRKE